MHTARVLEVITPASNQPAGEQGSRGNLALTKEIESTGNGSGIVPHAKTIAYFDFLPVPLGIAGYTWDFPTQIDLQPMRCWGIYDSNLLSGRRRPPLRDVLAEEMSRHGCDLDRIRLQGHPIRWFSPLGPLSVPRVLLVGDAAGADGIFGEGISMALGYGRLAAEAISDAVMRGDFSFRTYRSRILRSPLGQALTIRTGIAHILYRLHWAWFQRFFWRLFKPVVAAISYAFVINWARRMK
jgi:flavin-dependent dehydrogenase